MKPQRFERLSFLIVDSSDMMRGLTRFAIETRGGRDIWDVRDAHEAIRMCRSLVPHVVIVDIDPPRRSGLTLARMLRTHGQSVDPMVPIIMTAEAPTREDVLAAREAGVDEFLIKPFSAAELCSRVDRALAVRSSDGRSPMDTSIVPRPGDPVVSARRSTSAVPGADFATIAGQERRAAIRHGSSDGTARRRRHLRLVVSNPR